MDGGVPVMGGAMGPLPPRGLPQLPSILQETEVPSGAVGPTRPRPAPLRSAARRSSEAETRTASQIVGTLIV